MTDTISERFDKLEKLIIRCNDKTTNQVKLLLMLIEGGDPMKKKPAPAKKGKKC